MSIENKDNDNITGSDADLEIISTSEFEDKSEDDDNEVSPKQKKGFHVSIHIILVIIILIIFGISAWKLINWNKGETIELDPNEDTSEFDVEVLDEILPLSTDTGDHVYDDETTILLLGDGDLAMSEGKDSSLAGYIASAAEAKVYNGAFPYVSLAGQNVHIIEENYPDDIYSLPYVADAICTGDFSEMDRITEQYHADGTTTKQAVQTLKAVDYDNLDVIVIMYDAQDYFFGRAIQNPDDLEERCTYTGALKYAVEEIQETYPYVRIIVSSMFYAEGFDDSGAAYDPDLVDKGNGTISNYVYNQLQTCADMSISFLDNFYGTINQNNHEEYIDYETYKNYGYIALTDAGRQALAKRIAYAVTTFQNDK